MKPIKPYSCKLRQCKLEESVSLNHDRLLSSHHGKSQQSFVFNRHRIPVTIVNGIRNAQTLDNDVNYCIN